MAKDFAFLFYVNDWAGGTQWLTRLERGAYLDLLLYQVNNICFTHEIAKQILGADYDTVWANLAPKFVEENGKLWNKKMRAVLESRQKYTDSRRNNRLGIKKKTSVRHKKNISKTYVQHMGNENENEKEDEIGIGKDGGAGGKSLPTPTLAQCETFFQQCGKKREDGEKFYHHYQAQGWKIANGQDVTDWASLAQKWILNPKENKNGKPTQDDIKRKFDENYAFYKKAGNPNL